MNDILKESLDRGVIIYMDDIMIYSKILTEYCVHVWKVINWSMESGLAADIEKCVPEEKKVSYFTI